MDFNRYKKQMLVKEFGQKGQEQLAQSTIVIIGAGGLGSNSANMLTRTGVGTIQIVDNDPVELSNLHRTSIFTEQDIGKNKCIVLAERLTKVNSHVTIKTVQARIDQDNIEQMVHNADIILDGTDNMDTRFLINEASIKHDIPWVYAGVYSTVGMVMGIIPGDTPCLRCISNSISPSKNGLELPTFSIIPVTIATIQCMEAIKILLGEKPTGFLIYDLWKHQFESLDLHKKPTCSCCAQQQFKRL